MSYEWICLCLLRWIFAKFYIESIFFFLLKVEYTFIELWKQFLQYNSFLVLLIPLFWSKSCLLFSFRLVWICLVKISIAYKFYFENCCLFMFIGAYETIFKSRFLNYNIVSGDIGAYICVLFRKSEKPEGQRLSIKIRDVNAYSVVYNFNVFEYVLRRWFDLTRCPLLHFHLVNLKAVLVICMS